MLTFPSGKAYVGITKYTAEKRFVRHVADANRGGSLAVHCAIRKYGERAVEIKTLALTSSYDALRLMEQRAISTFSTRTPHGYNVTAGGGGVIGMKFNAETLAKMSASHTGRKHSDETKAKMRANNIGKTLSSEHRAKLSTSAMGRKASEETVAKMIVSRTGNPKVIAAQLGKKRSAESIARQRASCADRNRILAKQAA